MNDAKKPEKPNTDFDKLKAFMGSKGHRIGKMSMVDLKALMVRHGYGHNAMKRILEGK